MKARILCSIALAILLFSVGASATPNLYATSPQPGLVTDNVSVTDTATNIVIASVDVGNAPELTPPVVRYSANPRYGKAPLTVVFKDNSTGSPYAWNWNFGDGTFSTIQNPTHTYSQAGNYSVTLTVTNAAGSSSFKKSKYIQVITLPVVKYSANPRYGEAPLTVAFKDNSTGSPYAWNWNFGDGINSTQQNPIHTYSQAGNYSVTLTVTNASGSSSLKKAKYIQVVTLPVVKYSANPRYGKAPLTVAFKDNSTGSPYAWNWNFGDGAFSTSQNPTYTYSQAGNYSVTLTVTNASGSSSFKKAKYIQVIANTN